MKKVYLSLLLHGNMCYDRYTKQEIRAKFPAIYATGIRMLRRFPQMTAHIDFPGLTLLSLKHHAPWLLDEMRPLIAGGQVVMVGCQYAASHSLCADEESDLLASRLGVEMLRDEFGIACDTFFPQEMVFHPQMPLMMRRIGVHYLVVYPVGWTRPRRVWGLDGSEVVVCPLDMQGCRLDALEAFYDAHDDGDFVLAGGDFELLGDLEEVARSIDELAARGKIIEWTTVERYAEEVGIADVCDAPTPFGQTADERVASPSFSRWVGDPEDMIWHEHAVTAMEAVRTAGFAEVVAGLHGLDEVNVALTEMRTTLPDNAWDHRFEETREYPETEARYLGLDGVPTLLSHARHHLLIGLNSDASGWFPWTPRTRHRNLALQTATALAREVQARLAEAVAAQLAPPLPGAVALALAFNPTSERRAEVEADVSGPMCFVDTDGRALPTQSLLRDGRWTAQAEVALPAYGYKRLALQPCAPPPPLRWTAGARVEANDRAIEMAGGILRILGEGREIGVSVAPFQLSDPSGAAGSEHVVPDWRAAETRVRETLFGPELEVFAELAWAVWLRLVLGVRSDRIEVAAEIHVDLPRRIGRGAYAPEGLVLRFQGGPGEVRYDVPYGTIVHPNRAASYVAVQRFAHMDGPAPFGIVCLSGCQSFFVCGDEGVLGANLGASTQGRPDTRPECVMHEDGTAEHRITSGGDPFMGTYRHRFALVFGDHVPLALAARRLRTPVPVFAVEPGAGAWPAAQSLLEVEPETAHVTAFRKTSEGHTLDINDVSGAPCTISCEGQQEALPAYGVITASF